MSDSRLGFPVMNKLKSAVFDYAVIVSAKKMYNLPCHRRQTLRRLARANGAASNRTAYLSLSTTPTKNYPRSISAIHSFSTFI